MPNLLFCMTPGVGLAAWEKNGSFDRELKVYREYARRGWRVRILTFDRGNTPKLPEGIDAVSFPDYRFLWFLPWLRQDLGRWADVIKTNQSQNAYFYISAAKFWRKPILLRCGYIEGENLEATLGLTPSVKIYQWLESLAFRNATHCQVPTEILSEWAKKNYRVPPERISVVPNFVDIDVFRPIEGIKKKELSVIAVGRLRPAKQYDLLIRACAMISNCSITIVGEGTERRSLENLAKDLGINLTLPGNVPNKALPAILQEHQLFAITSKWEGHPKALIEAMACGMPCIGTNSDGIRNLIRHGENGVMAEDNAENLSYSIKMLLNDDKLRNKLGLSARKYAEIHYDFAQCFSLEYERILRMCENPKS